MAKITICGFCGGSAINHDHDECAEKFGMETEKMFLRYAFSLHNLPTNLNERIYGAKGRLYAKYLERQQ